MANSVKDKKKRALPKASSAALKTYHFPVRPDILQPLSGVTANMRFFTVEEFPDNLRQAMLTRDERSRFGGGIDRVSSSSVSGQDYYTPLLKGKDWLLELTCKYQPRTGKLLMDGGPLVLIGHLLPGSDPENKIDNLIMFRMGLEVQGNMVFFARMNIGNTPSDEVYAERQIRDRERLAQQDRPVSIVNCSMPMCTPFEISQAYFQRFWGLRSLGIELMPFAVNGTELGDYLKGNRLARKYGDLLNEKFKNIDLAEEKKPVDALSVLSDSFGMWSSQCDLLFLESYREHSPIYYVRNREFETIRILDNYVEGLDNYYYYLLTGGRRNGPFDFMPYTKPFGKR